MLTNCNPNYRGSNILVCEPNQQILLCDLEYAGYGARGFDIASFLTEWGRELFSFDNFGLPEDSVIENFVKLYVDACNELVPGYVDKPENQLQTVVNEAKVYFLANFMFFLVFMFKQTESLIPQIPYDSKSKMVKMFCFFTLLIYFYFIQTYVNKYYTNYMNIKKKLIEDKVI